WGWSDSWDTSLTVDSDGSVNLLGPAGSLRRFQPDSRGGYFAQPGDHGTLTKRSGGCYTLTELNGQITAYNANGTLNYVQDTNDMGANATTAHALLSVTHSDGSHDYFSYDARGRLADAHRDGGADDTTFSYSVGQVGVTDALSDATRYFFDNRGLLVQVENPL